MKYKVGDKVRIRKDLLEQIEKFKLQDCPRFEIAEVDE